MQYQSYKNAPLMLMRSEANAMRCTFPPPPKHKCQAGWKNLAAYGEGKIRHTNFHQAGIYHFRDRCDVFVSNCKFAYLTQ